MTHNKAYQAVLDRLADLVRAGAMPWRARWSRIGPPYNFVTGRLYRGINVLVLGSASYGQPGWLTYKQALDIGGHVRKGETGTPVLFYQQVIRQDEDGQPRMISFARSWTVFNVEQCEGIEVPTRTRPLPSAEAIVTNMPDAPDIHHGGNRAYYAPYEDYVQMPPRSAFVTSGDYYATLFHELVHSTGHESRLKRLSRTRMITRWDYAFEELIAEIGAALLCAQCGLDNDGILRNNAGYLNVYLNNFDDLTPMFRAAVDAQAAADYILNTQPDGAGEGA
jgi:antirestriction protein ArdC